MTVIAMKPTWRGEIGGGSDLLHPLGTRSP